LKTHQGAPTVFLGVRFTPGNNLQQQQESLMQIDISGHHVEITDAIRQSVIDKFSKVESHFPQLDALTVILEVEKHEQKVEARTQFLGAPVSVHASNGDMYVAIAASAKKMQAALKHRKGAVKSNFHEKPAVEQRDE